MSDGYVNIDIEITDEEVAALVGTGFVALDPDGTLVLSAAGAAWLQEWCRGRIAEHEAKS